MEINSQADYWWELYEKAHKKFGKSSERQLFWLEYLFFTPVREQKQ